ncbi:hypothetical protein [Haladaptatus paucihalophilus]|nr:hypothetical protein [Haladaptatus paucihalophilus]
MTQRYRRPREESFERGPRPSGGSHVRRQRPPRSHGTMGQQPRTRQGTSQRSERRRMGGEVGPKSKFEDLLTSEVQMVLHDFQKLETTAEWCANECIERGPELATCARTCRDIADIAHLGVQLLSRNPYRRTDVGDAILNAFLDARDELQRYRYPPVMDTVQALDRAVESLSKAIETVQRRGGGTQ